eukprot:1156069-Pelagomonas_calceolata.AAC.4
MAHTQGWPIPYMYAMCYIPYLQKSELYKIGHPFTHAGHQQAVKSASVQGLLKVQHPTDMAKSGRSLCSVGWRGPVTGRSAEQSG